MLGLEVVVSGSIGSYEERLLEERDFEGKEELFEILSALMVFGIDLARVD